MAVVLSCAATLAAEAETVTLAWDRNPESNISGYVLYYGTAPGQYTGSIAVGNVAQYVFNEPVDGRTYFFALAGGQYRGTGRRTVERSQQRRHPLADVLFDNGARGIWALTDGGDYRQINAGNPTTLITGDLDGNGVSEVIADFGAGPGHLDSLEWHHLGAVERPNASRHGHRRSRQQRP